MQNTKYGKGLKKLTDDHTKAKDAILQVFNLRNYTTYINFGHYYNSHVQKTRRSFGGQSNKPSIFNGIMQQLRPCPC